MTLGERVDVLTRMGKELGKFDDRLQAYIHRASIDNPWFLKEFIEFGIREISRLLSDPDLLLEWAKAFDKTTAAKRIGIIMAGNIPMVGFHDLLCVFISGNQALIKLSDKDKYLIPYLTRLMGELDPRTSGAFTYVDKLTDFDAVIATGSNNSARYFEYYFGKYPNIIRRNRNAVAILDGQESPADLEALADDVFLYFGLGCRNVSHLFVPYGYDFTLLADAMSRYDYLAKNSKYRNNYDYNLALLMLNKTPHIPLPNVVLVEQDDWISPVSTLYYSFYSDREELLQRLHNREDEVQCVISGLPAPGMRSARFGTAQMPALDDYADGIDTMAFLQSLLS